MKLAATKAKPCKRCGTPQNYRRSALCQPCYYARAREKNATRRAAAGPSKCVRCGAEFPFSPLRRYCSYKCQTATRLERERKLPVPDGEKPCKGCGSPFTPNTAWQLFCTDQCKEQTRHRRRYPRSLAEYSASRRVTLTCRQCNKDFTVPKNETRGRNPRYCSSRCWYQSQRQPRTCAGCKKEIPHVGAFKNKYCSHACRVEHHGFRAKIRRPRPCETCGAEFIGGSRFCSWSCYKAKVKATRKPPRTLYHERSWRLVARAIRKRDDYECQGCGTSSQRALAVDHLVPYKIAKRLADLNPSLDPNSAVNLLSLCGSCHADKTYHEAHVRRGDYRKFYEWASLVVSPGRLQAAMEYFGVWDRVARSA